MNNREAFEALEQNKGKFLPRTENGYRDTFVDRDYKMFCLGLKAFAEANVCSRSHPHDEMSETCKWLSVEAKKACLASQAQQPTVTDEMIAAAEAVEDLYRRGTPDTWKKVFLAMWREMPSVQSQAQQPTKLVFDSESARQFLIESVLPKFSDCTFADYVRNELAGDFAYQLAMYLQSQQDHIGDSNEMVQSQAQPTQEPAKSSHDLADQCKVAAHCLTYNESEAEAVAKHLLLEASQALRRSQAQQEPVSQWISVEEELPAYGQIVDLSIDGVLQNETYEIDATDNDLYLTHFWTRDGLVDGLDIEQGQFWRARLPMPKPLPPAPEGGDK